MLHLIELRRVSPSTGVSPIYFVCKVEIKEILQLTRDCLSSYVCVTNEHI